MPFWIEGWIEVDRTPKSEGEHTWFGVVRLLSIIEVWDADTERVFGLSKRYVCGECEDEAIAAGRGVPPNPSAQVRRELENIAEYETKYGPGEHGGYTYAVWSEIKKYKFVEQEIEPQLGLAFDLARVLELRYGPEGVRFVVWFNW